MPYSSDENREFVMDFVTSNSIKTVLDVGAGSGTYSDLLRDHVDSIYGVEAWEPYVEEFGLVDKYDELYIDDVRLIRTEELPVVDLVIFGDILEHMSKDDSVRVWGNSSKIARWGLASVPIVHYPQGAEFGNPYEVHVQDHLTPEDVRHSFGPFDVEKVYEVTGTFIKEFK